MSDERGQIVYLVSQGSYSDYQVVGVFSTRQNAKEFMQRLALDYPDWNDVEEMELDAPLPQMRAGFACWLVHMRRDGATERVERQETDTWRLSEAQKPHPSIWRRSTAPAYRGQNLEDLMTAFIWARDEQHAVKIANEKRAVMIADGSWDKPA